jgi:[ribosomal protein S5]-alanine N-acetyltransferase
MRNWVSAGCRTSASAALGAGPRVSVAPMAADDIAELAALLAGSARFHQAWVCYPTAPEAVRVYVREAAVQGSLLFAARRRSDGALVGLVSLGRITRGAWQSAECGCAVGASYRGNGYMAEAIAEVVTYAVSQLGLHRIEALVQPGNTASQRMLVRAGFHPEGMSRSSVRMNGAWLDHVRWAITADDLEDSEGGVFHD